MSLLRRFAPVGLVVVAGCLLSLAAFYTTDEFERHRAGETFELAAADRIFAVEHQIRMALEVLRSIVTFYDSSQYVARDEFHSFVGPSLARFAGIQALEWIPRVPDSERPAFEQAARVAGHGEFRFTERNASGEVVSAARRETYFPVYYLEPFAGNEKALGFDLASNPVRLAALESARDSGRLTASGRVTLVQERGRQSGVLVFAPIYRRGEPRDTAAERRRNLAGYALGVFRVGDLVSAAFRSDPSRNGGPAEFDLYIYDGDGNGRERQLHVHYARAGGAEAPILARLNSPLKKAPLTGFHPTAKHTAAKAISPSSETMRTI